MKISVSLFLFLTIQAFASDRTFNKLSKLYNSNAEKCLAVSKNQISKHPEKIEPYFFASRIYLDQFNKSTNLSRKYSNISRSISYGIKLDKKQDYLFEKKANWEVYRSEIIENSVLLIKDLRKAKFPNKAEKLVKKLKKLDGISRTNKITNKKKPVKKAINTTNNIAKVEFKSEFKNGQYFGYPTGTENIKSVNLKAEKEVLALVNRERKKQGMQPLIWDEDLAKAARYHAYDLATQNYFEHGSYDRIDGKLIKVGDTFTRIRKFYHKSFVNSENIAAGNGSAEKTYSQWYNSPGHYRNMFNKGSSKVGIGVYKSEDSSYGYYWVFCTAL